MHNVTQMHFNKNIHKILSYINVFYIKVSYIKCLTLKIIFNKKRGGTKNSYFNEFLISFNRFTIIKFL